VTERLKRRSALGLGSTWWVRWVHVGFEMFALGRKNLSDQASLVDEIGVGWCRDGRLL